ncbi:MAG TPA: molybdenum cofactor guanylyltransferase [Actinomycetota bacterium]|nr:molybdenum cofactor guanylyltransferase [Actinomycetota bacterium]
MRFDGIVLAGGTGARVGGVDKTALEVGGVALLERVVAALRDAERVVVVGPERAVARPVTWVREDPPGAGPVHALAAGLGHARADVAVVLAADLPFVGPPLVARLVAAAGGRDAALAVDARGRDQPLLAAYRTAALRAALAALPSTRAASMRALVRTMTIARVDAGDAAFDCDTWDDVAAARRRARG